jgi:hypothetical protein
MIRIISLFVSVFLFLSSIEAWSAFWLAGRWYVSSRFATVSLGTVKTWLDRGIVSGATQQAKVFIQRNGKLILLTLALSQVIPDVQRRIEASQYCYTLYSSTGAFAVIQSYSSRVFVSYADSSRSSQFWSYEYFCDGYSRDGSDPNAARFPLYYVYKLPGSGQSGMQFWAYLPAQVSFTLRSRDRNVVTCTVNTRWLMSLRECNSPVDRSWENERRRVPVRVFPNPSDFLRDDAIARDPSLQWLTDQYNRIARDNTIPQIPADALGDLTLPQVDWSVSPDEALDDAAESSRANEGSREGEGDISFPGFNTDLEVPAKRSFPLELVNNLVQSHPLLRVLQGVGIDTGSGGSCVIGSRPFEFDFCPFQWVLNLMGAVIVFVGFLTGLFWAGRSD